MNFAFFYTRLISLFAPRKYNLLMKKSYLISIFLLAALWGSDFMFIRIGVSSINPSVFATLRFLIASIYLFALLRWRKIDLTIRKQDLLLIGMTAFFDTFLPQMLISHGETSVASGITSIILSSSPIFTFVLAHFFLKDEKLTPYKVFFIITGFAGVLIIFLRELISGSNSFLVSGLVLITLASISYGFGVIMLKKLGERIETLKSCFFLVFTGFVLSLPVSIATGGFSSSTFKIGPTLSLIFAGIALQGFAYTFFFESIGKFGASKTSYVGYLVPLFGVLYGSLFLKETLTINALAGGALIIASAYFIEKGKPVSVKQTARNSHKS